MRYFLSFFLIIIFYSCQIAESKRNKADSVDAKIAMSDVANSFVDSEVSQTSGYDSLSSEIIDTTTLEGKRHSILNLFIAENGLVSPSDTLFDLNYDGYRDYVLRYYGKSGTGVKNRVKVYLFESRDGFYYLDSVLSGLPNPTFYISKRKITAFYIGNGGGSGVRLEWINKKWTATKEFTVDSEGDSTQWLVNYPLKKFKKVVEQPFQMIPPASILETNISY